jgi:hypothetical protein
LKIQDDGNVSVSNKSWSAVPVPNDGSKFADKFGFLAVLITKTVFLNILIGGFPLYSIKITAIVQLLKGVCPLYSHKKWYKSCKLSCFPAEPITKNGHFGTLNRGFSAVPDKNDVNSFIIKKGFAADLSLKNGEYYVY